MNYREYSGQYASADIRSGTVYSYRIYVPNIFSEAELAVLVTHDGLNEAEAEGMARLYEEKEAPPCVIVGLTPGIMYPSMPGGAPRDMRFNDYDIFSSEYVDFLVDEFIPYIKEKYSLNLSEDPNMHMISGGSSGGISSWNGVWFRNDYFRRAYLSSPTFSAMARGNMAPVFMRLYETKPIRVFIDYSENEPDDYFGSSYCAALEGHYALQFAGYDYEWAFYPGEGHCSRINDVNTAVRILRFLWKDWDKSPVKAKRLSARAEAVIFYDQPWKESGSAFPEKKEAAAKPGVYRIEEDKIIFCGHGEEKTAAEGFASLSAIEVSSDLWRLYIADSSRGCIYAAAICEDGSLKDIKIFASLHMPTDFINPGAYDICVDCNDRVFAATELGVQCIRSYGLIDLILPLPQNQVPRRLAIKDGCLYAECGGKIYSRKIKSSAKKLLSEPETPKFIGYYD
ncbi:MAG: hypothetical protein KH317_08705 [Clostridiales bacterium]|nr:hypothetical protein [Clostridiales bacterium]